MDISEEVRTSDNLEYCTFPRDLTRCTIPNKVLNRSTPKSHSDDLLQRLGLTVGESPITSIWE